jgi:formylglycine-generating enzyme required for sulfatase activity
MEGLTPAYEMQTATDASWSTNPDTWGSVPTAINAKWNAVRIVSGSSGYRLPTEAQWEYAAKGGNTGEIFTWAGSDNVDDVAWHSVNSGNRTREVGRLDSNGLDLYDMSGNVAEWCWDWHEQYTSDPKNDPEGAPSGSSSRVIRGGGWFNSAAGVRSVYRSGNNLSGQFNTIGFRLVRP